ncbi:MAG TPA: peptidoglycan bridge formation glycyltransferase FemA/FemB family protein [Anaerolineales bacterium]|jgi:lipid II:glycine glycyltransferase (peptidoglycan interpeptide bridge formation enzyme)
MSETAWNDLIAALPDPHLLQTSEWGQLKARYGWQPLYLVWRSTQAGFQVFERPEEAGLPQGVAAAALVLKKKVLGRGFAARLCLLYCPKGPLLRWEDAALRRRVLDDLQLFARRQGAIFLKLDPDVVLGRGLPGTASDELEAAGQAVQAELSTRGWRYSNEQIQFRNTVLVDVAAPDEELLGRMKQKTRYNVRLGPKKGLILRMAEERDWPMLYRMYAETSIRDGFVIRDHAYYQAVWQIFARRSAALIAEGEGEPVAAVYLFHFAGRAYYLYGMSREAQREKMPNYMLQFEAMRWAREQGCRVYDLWGAPEEFDEGDPLWGVYRFKEGLGGQVQRTLGAWDYAPNALWYTLYTRLMPRVLDFMRSRGRQRTRQGLEA